MNPLQIKELIEFYPTQIKYLALYFDDRGCFWESGRYNAPMSLEAFWTVVESFNIDPIELDRDEYWLVIDLESGNASVLPWLEADRLIQQQYKDAPGLDLDVQFNLHPIALRISHT